MIHVLKKTTVLLLAISILTTFSSLAFATTTDEYGRKYVDEVIAPESYLEKSSYKLVRGVANVVTCPGEFPKQIVVTVRDRGAMGIVLGPLKGLGMLTLRGTVGVYEVITSPLANTLDGDFSAILKPEFVWTPSSSTSH